MQELYSSIYVSVACVYVHQLHHQTKTVSTLSTVTIRSCYEVFQFWHSSGIKVAVELVALVVCFRDVLG